MTANRVIDDHTELANIGTNTHAQIDTAIANAGDMKKTVYDTNNNGVVDAAESVDGGTW